MNAAAVHLENDDARGLHLNAGERVETDPPIMQDRGADRLRVTDDDGIPARLLHAFEMLHDAHLQLAHALALRRAAGRTPPIPVMPARIVIEPAERCAGPFADIDLIHLGADPQSNVQRAGNRLCGLTRTPAWTRFNEVDGYLGKLLGQARRLLMPRARQPDAGHSPAQNLAEGIMDAVSHEIHCPHENAASIEVAADELRGTPTRFVIGELLR